LKSEDGLASACKDHVVDTGPTGVEGHIGTDKSTPETRLDVYGRWGKDDIVREGMSYGVITGVGVIRSLIIGDGDSDRSNRWNIFNPTLKQVGIFSGTHKTHGH